MGRQARAMRSPFYEVVLNVSGRDVLCIEPEVADQQALAEVLGSPAAGREVRHAVRAILWPDPSSGYDSLGVAVWIDGRQVGWLDHAASARVVRLVRTLAAAGEVAACGAFVVPVPDADESPRLTVELLLDIEALATRARSIEVSDALVDRRVSGRVAS